MGLFKPAYFSKDRTKRGIALSQLPESKLKELFWGDLSSYSRDEKDQRAFRLDCLYRIEDQQFLAQVVVSFDDQLYADPFINNAIEHISDERLIYALLKRCKRGGTRSKAEQKLKNPDILRAVAVDPSMDVSLRAIALEKLNDPVLSAQIAREYEGEYLHMKAAAYLDENDALLADELAEKYLSGKESCCELGMFGFKNCRDDQLKSQLMQKLTTFEDSRLRDAAMDGFSDTMLLAICKDDKKQKLWRNAIMRMHGTDALWRLLSENSDDDIADAVYFRLGKIGSERDASRLAERIDDEKERNKIVDCISSIENCSRLDVLAKYGTEATAVYYLNRLTNTMGKNGEKDVVDALKALYRAGKGKAAIEPLRGQTLRGHTDANQSSCTPGWGHSDGHDDVPALRFDI